MAKTAKTRAAATPARMATAKAKGRLLVAKAAAKPANAPMSMTPSTPMLRTPERSQIASPVAAKTSGVERRQAAPSVVDRNTRASGADTGGAPLNRRARRAIAQRREADDRQNDETLNDEDEHLRHLRRNLH